MKDIKVIIEELIEYAKKHLYLEDLDALYKRNLLLDILGVDMPYMGEKLDLDFYKLINEINHVGNNLNQISRILNSKNPILENEVLENQRMVNAVLTNLNHQIKGAGNGNN